jgi:hypothetical protein
MTASGQEERFPPPRLSARCRFSQGTFAGTRGNGRDAPEADSEPNRSPASAFLLPKIARAIPFSAAMSSAAALHEVLAVLLKAVDAAVLHRVLGLLLERAEPVRQTAVLRAAITQLLAEDAFVERPAAAKRQPVPPRLAAQRAEAPSPTNTRWAELRPRTRALIESGVTEQEIADGLGIAPSTLRRLLTRVRREPSEAVIARATAWLAAREAVDARPDSRERTHLEQPDRLSVDQRERLNFLAERDPIGTRREAGLTRSQLEQAVAGEALDPAVVVQLTGFLTGDQGAASG